MADYSSIQQHQPIRCPTNWGKQERVMLAQLEEILDDIYKRFGRLRMKDMGEAFRNQISDDEGHISELTQTAERIVQEVAGKYGKVSGITIDEDGVTVTGSKKVDIKSGGAFNVDATDFKIDSVNKRMTIGDWETSESGLSGLVPRPGGGTIRFEFGHTNWRPADQSIGIREHTPTSIITGDTPICGMRIQQEYGAHSYTAQIAFDVSEVYDSGTDAYEAVIAFFPVAAGGNSYLGKNGEYWAHAYIKNVHYDQLIQISSREAKHDIEQMESSGEKIDRLVPVRFVYNNDPEEKKRLGLIYEDTVDVLPEICVDDGAQKGIDYVELIPVLLKEIQDLRIRVAALEASQR